MRKGEFHLDKASYDAAMVRARALKLREYLGGLTEARRQLALKDCEAEMRGLGLDPAAFGLANQDPRQVGNKAPRRSGRAR